MLPSRHEDLWYKIWEHVSQRDCGAVGIQWVKAHVDSVDNLNHTQKLDAFYKNAVDVEAKKAVCADAFDMWFFLGEIYKEKKEHHELVYEYHSFLLEMYEKMTETKEIDGKPCDTMPDFQGLALTQEPYIQYAPLHEDTLRSCPYGFEFASRFARWWSGLQWGTGSPVSFHELYVAYCLQTGSMAPVVLGQKRYALRDQSHEADIAPLSFSL